MSDDKGEAGSSKPEEEPKANGEPATEKPPPEDAPSPSGPTFEEHAPDPLAGVRSWSRSVWDSMEGKTVSMRTYVGSIAAVIVLMLLARCGS